MSLFVTDAVPFQPCGNRQVLTDEQVVSHPWLADFIERFRARFERDDQRGLWLYVPA